MVHASLHVLVHVRACRASPERAGPHSGGLERWRVLVQDAGVGRGPGGGRGHGDRRDQDPVWGAHHVHHPYQGIALGVCSPCTSSSLLRYRAAHHALCFACGSEAVCWLHYCMSHQTCLLRMVHRFLCPGLLCLSLNTTTTNASRTVLVAAHLF